MGNSGTIFKKEGYKNHETSDLKIQIAPKLKLNAELNESNISSCDSDYSFSHISEYSATPKASNFDKYKNFDAHESFLERQRSEKDLYNNMYKDHTRDNHMGDNNHVHYNHRSMRSSYHVDNY